MLMINEKLPMSVTERIRLVVVGSPGDLQSRLAGRGPQVTVVSIQITDDVVAEIVAGRPDAVLLCKPIGPRTALWLCRALKQRDAFAAVPVMFLGFGDDSAVESAAFAAGAADYVARPSTMATILPRLSAVLRRPLHSLSAEHDHDQVLNIGALRIQHQSYAATVDGRVIPLTASEFQILWKLARNVGVALPATELAPRSLDIHGPSPERSVRSHVCSLRRKLGRRAGGQIETVRNAGYRLTNRVV